MDHLHVRGQEETRVPKAVDPLEPALNVLLAVQTQHLVLPQKDHVQVLPPKVVQCLGVQLHGPGASIVCLQLAAPRDWCPPEGPTVVPTLGSRERNPKGRARLSLCPQVALSAQICLQAFGF